MISDIIDSINMVLWGRGQVLIYMLLLGGIFFTWKLGFIQIKYFTHMFRIMRLDLQAEEDLCHQACKCCD